MAAVSPAVLRRAVLRRRAAYLCVVVGLVPLIAVSLHDLAVDTPPCPLCLWERWPYRAVVSFGLVGGLLPRSFGRPAVLACLAATAVSIGLAGLHVGVERGAWPSPLPSCRGAVGSGELPALPAPPCDRPVRPLAGIPVSFAELNLGYGVLAAGAIAAAIVWRRRAEAREDA